MTVRGEGKPGVGMTPVFLTQGIEQNGSPSGKADASVGTLGPLDRRVGHILELGDEDNIWDLNISAPTGRTRQYGFSCQRMGPNG